MTILKAENLTKQFGKQTVINDLNLSLSQNNCIALIGPNGAGKTTTLRIITGLIKPTSGTIQFMNQDKDYRKLIGYLPQHPQFYEWMTGIEYIQYSARLSSLSKDTSRERANKILNRLGLLDAKDKRISTYSGGMKQRLGIAQAIIHQPKILVLDEPVSALDPSGRREMLRLIESLKEEMTILFSTHILQDADQVCDEVILLHQGKVLEAGPMEMIRKKYQSNSVTLTFTNPDASYEHALQRLKTVETIQVKQDIYHINVTNLQVAQQEILRLITDNHWEIESFYINRPTLDDVFVKVVEK